MIHRQDSNAPAYIVPNAYCSSERGKNTKKSKKPQIVLIRRKFEGLFPAPQKTKKYPSLHTRPLYLNRAYRISMHISDAFDP